MMSSSQWYYRVGERECGPVATEELRFLHQSGTITVSTQIREEGSGDWQSLRQSGLIGTGGKRNPKPEGRFSPAAPFQDRPAGKKKADAPEPVVPETLSRQKAPMLPGTPSGRRDKKVPLIFLGAFLGMLMLMVLAWLLWPDSNSSPGMASSGTGEGAADSGSDQSASETSANGAAAGAESPEAAEEVATAGSGENVDAPVSTSPAATAAETAAAETAGGSGESTSDTRSDSAVVADASKNDRQAGIDSAAADAPDTGLAVGDSDGSRFSISAPGETTFFGIRGAGRRFSYVVDCSGSMQGLPLSRATQELMASISKLPAHVEFQIVFFDDLTVQFPGNGAFTKASGKSKGEAKDFINGITGGGGTNVKLGMNKALSSRSKPDTIFLLTDGSFDVDTPNYIKSLNKGSKVRVNTVAFVNNAGEPLLKKIADENRGDYRFVP